MINWRTLERDRFEHCYAAFMTRPTTSTAPTSGRRRWWHRLHRHHQRRRGPGYQLKLGQGRAESARGRAADSGPGTGLPQRGNATSASNQVRWSGRLGASRIASARSASAGSARTGSGAGSGQSPPGQ